LRWLLACVLCLGGMPAMAATELYGELQLTAGGVRHSELDFYPVIGSASLGAFVYPGIGFEAFFDGGLSPGVEGEFDLELTSATGLAARFQSPPVDGLSGYIVLGYVRFSLRQEENDRLGVRTVSEDFTGVRLSIGMSQELSRWPNLAVSAEYRNYYVDEDIQVDGLSLGLRVNFQ